MGADQLARSELSRLRGARELRLLNGRGGQRSRGKRLFQSVPARDAQCPRRPAKGLPQPRKRAGQSGGRSKRTPRLAITYTQDRVASECRRYSNNSSELLPTP